MKRIIVLAVVLGLVLGIAGYVWYTNTTSKILNPISKEVKKITEKPLEKYTFNRLKKQHFPSSTITFGKPVKEETDFTSSLFYFTVNGKKVSGLATVPKEPGLYPVIVMFRGFVPKEIYTPGEGTKRAGEVFAQNGFITLAPDFLSYGESDNGPDVSHMILKQGKTLNWKRLLSHMDGHWEILFAHILNFRFIYPSEREIIPRFIMDEMIARLTQQFTIPIPKDKICRGTMLSRFQYEVDIKDWGYKDVT